MLGVGCQLEAEAILVQVPVAHRHRCTVRSRRRAPTGLGVRSWRSLTGARRRSDSVDRSNGAGGAGRGGVGRSGSVGGPGWAAGAGSPAWACGASSEPAARGVGSAGRRRRARVRARARARWCAGAGAPAAGVPIRAKGGVAVLQMRSGCGSGWHPTSACTGAGAPEGSPIDQCRRAGPVMLVVRRLCESATWCRLRRLRQKSVQGDRGRR